MGGISSEKKKFVLSHELTYCDYRGAFVAVGIAAAVIALK